MINIANILKDAPKGTKLYSPMFGECALNYVRTTAIKVKTDITYNSLIFDEYGRIFPTGECLLFPSKEVREWDNFSIKKEYEFKPFDKVIVRDEISTDGIWVASFFSHYNKSDSTYPYICINDICYSYCLPYNEETAKLIGTTDDYD